MTVIALDSQLTRLGVSAMATSASLQTGSVTQYPMVGRLLDHSPLGWRQRGNMADNLCITT